MPKINMYGIPNPDQNLADRRIELGWRPFSMGGEMQLGVTKLAEGAEEFRHREYFGATETTPAKPVWVGQFIDLDRNQINQLIRHLKDLRDSAYGRDE